MAVKSRHLAVATSLICAAIAVAYLPPDLRIRTSYQRTTHAEVIKSALSKSEMVYSSLQLRDSLLDLSRERRDSGERLVLLTDSLLPGEILQQLDHIVNEAREYVSAGDSTIALVVAVNADTMYVPVYGTPRTRWAGAIRYVLPANTDGKTCVAALQLGTNDLERILDRGQLSAVIPHSIFLGPCAFYSAFGPPGSEIQQWLESSAHELALFPEWVHGDSAPSRSGTELTWFAEYGDVLTGCYRGDARFCAAAAMPKRDGSGTDLDGLVTYSTSRLRWQWISHSLGPNAANFLSDLLLDIGRDRFTQFWTSDGDIELAFASAVGAPLGEWTMSWVRQQYNWSRRRGPSISMASTLLGLLIAVGVLGASVAAAALRHVE